MGQGDDGYFSLNLLLILLLSDLNEGVMFVIKIIRLIAIIIIQLKQVN